MAEPAIAQEFAVNVVKRIDGEAGPEKEGRGPTILFLPKQFCPILQDFQMAVTIRRSTHEVDLMLDKSFLASSRGTGLIYPCCICVVQCAKSRPVTGPFLKRQQEP